MMLFIFIFIAIMVQISALDAKSEEAQNISKYALSELQKLSDSGVYSTLSISQVLSARQEDGIFHHNTLLTLELASPFFQSKSDTENFDIVVMKHKEDGIRSIAIDEFPVMNEDAIEKFWINKVEEKKIAREEAFRRLEIQAILNRDSNSNGISNL